MILKRIKIHNIRSYKDGEVIFPEGSTLLMGDIGSGKTSVLLAIEFVLFGLQPSQKGSSILRNNEEEAIVTLELQVDDKQVIIERKLKKGGKSITQADASISIDNEKYEGSVTEVKNKVLTLLSYPQEFAKKTNDLYKFTVYTPQEEMKQIILESSDVRLNTLRHVFGIDKYKRIEENLTAIGIKIRQEIRLKEIQAGNIVEIKREIEEERQKAHHFKQRAKELEFKLSEIKIKKVAKEDEMKKVEEKISEKNNLEREKAKAEIMLASKKESIKDSERLINNLRESIIASKKASFKEQELSALKQKITVHEQLLKEANEEHLKIASRLQSQEESKRDIEKLKNKIFAMTKCPTCLQDVNNDYKENILRRVNCELEVLNEKSIVDLKAKQEIVQKGEQERKHLEELRNAISQMEILKIRLESIKEKEKRLEDSEKQKISLLKDVVLLDEQVNNISMILQGFEVYAKEFELKNKEFKDIVLQENSVHINQAEINKEIQFAEQQMIKMQEEAKRVEEIAKKITNLRSLESWLSTKFLQLVLYTERSVMLKLREEFSELFGKWFSILVSEEISVRLDETFSPIIQQNDYELDYNFLSGGERTAVALAYRLALNQVINSLLSKIKTRDLVILDEPTDGFSESQLDKMRDVLQQLKVKQLIIVSHEQKVESFVDNIIRFKKVNGSTQIES